MDKAKETYPLYLQESINNYVEGYENNSPYLDGLYMDLQSSINSAEVDLRITKKEAQILRNKHLFLD